MERADLLCFETLTDGFRCAVGVLEDLRQQDILPTPRAYELWLVHKRGAMPRLSERLSALRQTHVPITAEIIDQLRSEFGFDAGPELDYRQEASVLSEDLAEVADRLGSDVDHGKILLSRVGDTLTQSIDDLRSCGDGDESLRLIARLAGQIGGMVEEIRTIDRAVRVTGSRAEEVRSAVADGRCSASLDPVSGAGHRRGLEIRLGRTLAKLRARTEAAAAVLVVDIDRFDRLGEDHGNDFRTLVLRLAGRLLIDSVKGRDYVARLDGGQFGVLLVGADLQAGGKVARQIGASLANTQVRLSTTVEHGFGRVTASLGVAEMTAHDTVASVLERAEYALAAAKRNGRNRVVTERDTCFV